jgi:glutamate synthase (NADPH/NADH) small chain
MVERDPAQRARTFEEVALGYDDRTALAEARRCMKCKVPRCERGCPVQVRIRDFISAIAEEDMPRAVQALKERNALPAVCGRVCPQETQCESRCVLTRLEGAVAIGRLERYVADWDRQRSVDRREPADTAVRCGKRIAVVGSGPAGLACAGELVNLGCEVTVFEAMHTAGGVLAYGIPEFRLPKAILHDELSALERAGVTFKYNQVVGRITDAQELLESGFDAVFFGTGAGLPTFLGIDGENFNGVYSANEFLTRINLRKAYRFPAYDTPIWEGHRVVVVGGGNVAMDAARCALRLRADNVTIVYRRTRSEMPARNEEIEHAIEEGISIRELCAPLRIIGSQGWCTGLEVQQMELSDEDESGRRRPISDGSEPYVIDCDTIITAVGTGANPLTSDATSGVMLNERGYVITDEEGRTSNPRIFAGGDIVTGAATVILAMGAGKRAAQAIANTLDCE